MNNQKQYGLCIQEQALVLWVICKYSENPETCPQNLMGELKECPFDCDCNDVQPKQWVELLSKREAPCSKN